MKDYKHLHGAEDLKLLPDDVILIKACNRGCMRMNTIEEMTFILEPHNNIGKKDQLHIDTKIENNKN